LAYEAYAGKECKSMGFRHRSGTGGFSLLDEYYGRPDKQMVSGEECGPAKLSGFEEVKT
jgi:hypothetical protein